MRLLLHLWARRVPLVARDRWIEEWVAELSELERREQKTPAPLRYTRTLRFTFGARAHAVALARADDARQQGMTTMTMMGRDLKYAVRSFSRSPGFTAVAVITLALGIGATTTMFSVLDGVMLRPLPYENPEELVMIGSSSQRFPGLAPVSPADFRDWREQNTTFSHMIATEWWNLDLTDTDQPARISSAAVSGGFFEMLGAVPSLGRGLLPSDEVEGAEPVVVLSHGLWQRRYGGDPSVVGTRVTTADQVFTVVGVMPETFVHPEALWSEDVELWLPTSQTGSDMTTRGGRFLQVMGRMRPGVSVFAARQEMSSIAAALAEQYPQNVGRETLIEPLQEETIGDVGQALTLLMGAVGMLLLIACANVANLFMARAAARGRELAVRTAIGAGRARIRAQLLTEGVVLSLVGGLVGVLLAFGGVAAFRSVNPVGMPRVTEVSVDARVLAFALVVSVLTGVGFALVPALRLGTPEELASLRDGGRTVSGAGARFRNTLVAAELALAVVLMVGAGLFVNSFLRLQSVDPGFDARNAVTMAVSLNSGYETSEERITFFRQLEERMEAIRDVSAVAYTSALPLAGDRYLTGITIEGREVDPSNPDFAEYSRVSPGYFAAMGVDMVAGREFDDRDDAASDLVAVVNEAFVRQYWSGENPLGRRVARGRREPTWYTVVGVSGDVNRQGLTEPATAEIFFSSLQSGVENAQVVARTDGDTEETVAAMRSVVAELDGNLPVEFSTLEAYVAASVDRPQFYTQLFSTFALVALVLAGVGVYGTMSYTVGQRTREMGIRLALGAEASEVTGLIAREGLIVAVVGLTIGLVGAAAGARLLESFLFGVGARDPLTYGVGALFLGGIAMAACWIPARRAGRADPVGALQAE